MNIVKMSDMEIFEMFKAIRWDESNAYDDFTDHYDMNRVNHQIEYLGIYGEKQ